MVILSSPGEHGGYSLINVCIMEATFKKILNPANASFILRKDGISTPAKSTWHYHAEYELLFFREGRGTRFIGDSIEAIEPGEVILMGSNLPHAFARDTGFYERNSHLEPEVILVQFDKDFLGTDIWSKTEFLPLLQLLKKAQQGLKFHGPAAGNAAATLTCMMEQRGIKSITSLLCLLEDLATCQQYDVISSCGFLKNHGEMDEKINRVYEFTIKNFRDDITLDRVARIAYLSRSPFCRYFKTRTSKTYSRFLAEVRIGYACKLLIEDKLNVSEICYDCGYRNLSNFNRHFKHITGMTPSDYHHRFQNYVEVKKDCVC